jgi:RNA polymerase sigma-70 factor (ECF subfamily)
VADKEAAFKKIYEANSKKIYHLCYGYTGDDDAASDLLQETFLKVWQNLEKFRNQAMISTWIYRIAVNTCLTYLRSEKRQAKDELTPLLAETKKEELSEKNEQVALLYKCISKLEESERRSSLSGNSGHFWHIRRKSEGENISYKTKVNRIIQPL